MINLSEYFGINELFEKLDASVYWADCNGALLGCNQAMLDDLQLDTLDDVLGKVVYEFIDDVKLASDIKKNDAQVIRAGCTFRFDETLVIDSVRKFYLSYKMPLENKLNEIIGVVGVLFNITEMRILEYENQSALQNILNYLPASIYWIDKSGRVRSCNNYMLEEVIGKPSKDVIGKSLHEFMPSGKALDQLVSTNKSVMDTGEIHTSEETTDLDIGKNKVYQSHKAPLRNPQGDITGMIGVTFDITAQKENERLKQEKEVAEEKAKMMMLVGGIIAHEMRNPLHTISLQNTTIKNMAELCVQFHDQMTQAGIETNVLKSDIKAMLDVPNVIESTVQKARTFIDMLLQKLKNDSTANQEVDQLSINEIVEQAIQSYPIVERENIDIVFTKGQDFRFDCDPVFFTHVIYNLLKNAIFYVLKANVPKPEIKLWTEQQSEWNILHFKDNGTGISADILPHVFKQFFSRSQHGTGIGLAYCKNVMETMKGKIECHSVENEYTHFMLYFPKS